MATEMQPVPSLTAVILTLNEQKHIQRCIRSLEGVVQNILVIDSFSVDDTAALAQACGAKVLQHRWKNYAEQFQWGLDQLSGTPRWIMRMDADEYLEPDLRREIIATLGGLPEDVDGIYLKRKVFFEGQWIRYGGFYPQTLLRIWRAGKGRIEQRWMDEHILLPPGSKTLTLQGHLVDDNLKGISFWTDKHNGYATREMADILVRKYFPGRADDGLRAMDADRQARGKRALKEDIYTRLPAGWRAGLYFCYRYFWKLGFLDGSKGFTWHFLQGFWYRLLVDLKVMELERRAQGDAQKVQEILMQDYGIEI